MLNAARNDCIFFIYPFLKIIEKFFGKFFLNCPIEKKETPPSWKMQKFLENFIHRTVWRVSKVLNPLSGVGLRRWGVVSPTY